jgi:type VI protein secretion system component VasF
MQAASDAQKARDDHSALQQHAAALQSRVVELHTSGSFEEAQSVEQELRDSLTNAERARKRARTCKVILKMR